MRGGASSDWREGIVAVFYGIDMYVSSLKCVPKGLRTRHAISNSSDYSPDDEFGETERGRHDCEASVSMQNTSRRAGRGHTGGAYTHHDHSEHDRVSAAEAI